MPDANALITKALPELAKWGYEKYRQSRASFEDLARKTLADILKKRNKNERIVDKTIENLLADPALQNWLDGAQLPSDLTFEKLAGRVKIDPFILREFLLAFEKKIAADPQLREEKKQRLAAENAQFNRQTSEILEKRYEGPEQERQSALADYRQKVRKEFSNITLFGDRAGGDGEESVIERMSDMTRGFVPLHLKAWRDEQPGADDSALELEDVFFKNRKRLILVRGLPGGGKTTLLRYLAWRFAADKSGALPIYVRLEALELEEESLTEFIRIEICLLYTSPSPRDPE